MTVDPNNLVSSAEINDTQIQESMTLVAKMLPNLLGESPEVGDADRYLPERIADNMVATAGARWR